MGSPYRGIHTLVETEEQLAPSLLQIGVPWVTRLAVENQASEALGPGRLQLTIPGLSAAPVHIDVPVLPAGAKVELGSPPFPADRLDWLRLQGLAERDDGWPGRIEASLPDGAVVGSRAIHVLPPNAWLYRASPEALAAFITKEGAAVRRVTEAARGYLHDALGVESFADALAQPITLIPERTTQVIQAFYRALGESFRLHFENELRTYPLDWQKIRPPERVLSDGQGTCIDLVLLLMACLESVHLDPLLVLVRIAGGDRHALLGCWQDGSREPARVLATKAMIASRLRGPAERDRLVLIDATGVTVERRWSFPLAVETAENCFEQATDFFWALNLGPCRSAAGDRSAVAPLPFADGPSFAADGWEVVGRAEELARRFSYDIIERSHLLLALLELQPQLIGRLVGSKSQTLQAWLTQNLEKRSPRHCDVPYPEWTKAVRAMVLVAGRPPAVDGITLAGPLQLAQALFADPGETVKRSLREIGTDAQTLLCRLRELREEGGRRRSSYPEPESGAGA